MHPLAHVVRFVPHLVQKWTHDFTDEEWPKRPRKELHSAQWILGHLVVTLAGVAGAASRLPSWGAEFRPDALRTIAEKALTLKTGVRAARSIIEDLMLDVVYHLPDRGKNLKYVVTREFARGEAEITVGPRPGDVRRESA